MNELPKQWKNIWGGTINYQWSEIKHEEYVFKDKKNLNHKTVKGERIFLKWMWRLFVV